MFTIDLVNLEHEKYRVNLFSTKFEQKIKTNPLRKQFLKLNKIFQYNISFSQTFWLLTSVLTFELSRLCTIYDSDFLFTAMTTCHTNGLEETIENAKIWQLALFFCPLRVFEVKHLKLGIFESLTSTLKVLAFDRDQVRSDQARFVFPSMNAGQINWLENRKRQVQFNLVFICPNQKNMFNKKRFLLFSFPD